ncbi:RICIN domain-containing protein [Paenibacillus oryzisoli]|uniref:Ricin B lectin domain-containing protein n=1 Tax=Paenibacillus oryzisoli TaxID=1850517 RepID=A0A198AMC3_9BACL|nr:RICIN domain-containing protein [Paenibacillus oryzisoli]OAS22392.1 hypothetical protein A8708_12550 [Paenibacillus oryzisoli]
MSMEVSSLSKKIIAGVMAVLFVLSMIYVQPAKAASVDIVNNTNWYDTDGNEIWAQGGFVIQKDGTHYWYGMDYSVSGVKKINLYTSTDLKAWTKHESVVDFTSINVKLDAIGDTTTKRFLNTQWVGRPVVAYNSATSKYVMISEWGSGDGNRNKLMFFTSDNPDGPFTYEKNIAQPGGFKMGDLGSIFTDDDGSTYITYTIDYVNTNGGLQISQLTSDYLDLAGTTKTFVSTGPYKEATTLFKRNGKYIMLASTTNGWSSSQTWCYSTLSLSGTWANPYVCATSPYSGNSYDTQTDQVLPIQGTSGTMYMYIGDRWNNMGGSTGIGRIQWYPLTFDSNGAPTINGYGQWSLDAAAGTWAPSAGIVDTTKQYTITNRWSNKALGTVGNSTSTGASIEQRGYTAAAGQTWQFIDAGSGYYRIKNVNSGMFMDISGNSTADGASNIQWTNTSGNNQMWQLIDAGGGYVRIKNRNSGKVLGFTGGSTADGALSVQVTDTNSWSQQFTLSVSVPINVTKTYALMNRNSGKALNISNDSTADGATVVQNTYGTKTSQAWQFIDAGGGYVNIKNVNSGKFMNISGASMADGGQTIQWTDNGSNNQQWLLVDVGGGYFKLKNRNSGKVLGMSAGTTAEGGVCIQWSETGSLNQNWSFTILNP